VSTDRSSQPHKLKKSLEKKGRPQIADTAKKSQIQIDSININKPHKKTVIVSSLLFTLFFVSFISIGRNNNNNKKKYKMK
jgi:hypothetical protein